MRVLISGAGIAGPTLAFWLKQYGIEPTIIEVAPKLRTGGYIIDFWGTGYKIAGRMGLLSQINDVGYRVREVHVVDRSGKRISGFPVDVFWRATGGLFTSLRRGDLAAVIFGAIDGRVETIFGETLSAIEQDQQAVRVKFERSGEREFDLVVGADGLHSRVRQLVFGEESRFEHYLGIKVAAFEVQGYRPRDELVYVMYTEVGQQVTRFTMRDDRTLFLFTFADPSPEGPEMHSLAAQKALLHRRYGQSGWELPQILDALDATDELYFDRVSQIRMDPQQGLWTRGRVTLVGDAASCASLLAGEGSGLAITAAYILAGELKRSGGDYTTAFARYQQAFAPFVSGKQEGAAKMGGNFAPKSKSALWLRNLVMNFMNLPWVADFAFGRQLTENIELPNY
ncbi:MAG TPA: FAD-binding domain [Candidatus Bathyarchaeia archaeon]|nr:FAD-binding domain [Candidatus Bathyarchaeia archaeon]